MTTLRITAATVDKKNLTLYTETGEVHEIPQTDPRVDRMIKDLMPIVLRGEIAIVNLEEYSAFADFEKKSNGLVRFFKVAKKKVMHFFGVEDDPEEVVFQQPAEKVTMSEPVIKEAPAPMTAEQVITEAEVYTGKEAVSAEETIVAVIETETGKAAIPHAEQLTNHIQHASLNERTEGMEKFYLRLAAVQGKRAHSAHDIIRFLERGDLPIADDGSIIAYKILKRGNAPDTYVDCHTKKVTQKIGSYVVVDESLVDRNRHNECSNGLHIARRGYLGGFHGDVCVLIKLAPEDVITVPHGDPNKVRVCGYHILGLIPDAEFERLKQNKPMTANPIASKLLADAISGNHVEKLEEVRITEQYGGGVIITPLVKGKKIKSEVTQEDLKHAKAFDDVKNTGVDPKQINKLIQQEEAKIAKESVDAVAAELDLPKEEPTRPITNAQRAKSLHHLMISEVSTLAEKKEAAQGLLDLKKKAKVSWEKLGFNFDILQLITMTLAMDEPKPETVITLDDPNIPTGVYVTDKNAPTLPVEPVKTDPKPLSGSNKDKARTLYQMKDWLALADLKKKAKVSWERLGFTQKEEEEILGVLKK